MIRQAPNNNRFWADLIVEELVRHGVDHFFIAPGSRSSPLVAAVAAHAATSATVHFDERGTAFAALGYARAAGRPAAWITTSGTAVANGLPAVVEAAADNVPLVLLTADRPPELRDTGANQTIDQVRIFGDYVQWFVDMPTPSLEIDPRYVLTTVDQALARAVGTSPGPVHLNCAFREPLAPEPDHFDRDQAVASLEPWLSSNEAYTTYRFAERPLAPHDVNVMCDLISSSRRGVIVLGRQRSSDACAAVLGLAEHLDLPVFADILSNAHFKPTTRVIKRHDILLSDQKFRQESMPDLVLQFGQAPVSKRTQQFLNDTGPMPHCMVAQGVARIDPGHRVTQRFDASVATVCAQIWSTIDGGNTSSGWVDHWRDADNAVNEAVATFLNGREEVNEPGVAAVLAKRAAADEISALVVGSSLPIRYVDTFAEVGASKCRVYANRGASGIDGTVATAAGVALGSRNPVTLLLGDLALLHDLNSLALARTSPYPITTVVVNNDGGGIFSFLPIASSSENFEPFFGTPHGLDFEKAAAQFGLLYARPQSMSEFVRTIEAAATYGRSSIIEVTTTRDANVALHEELLSIASGVLATVEPIS